METKAISVNLLNAILQYLNSQPYGQVNQLIQGLLAEANQEAGSNQVLPEEESEA